MSEHVETTRRQRVIEVFGITIYRSASTEEVEPIIIETDGSTQSRIEAGGFGFQAERYIDFGEDY